MNLQLHPLCTLFPRMEGAEFEALKADIEANGLRQPIVIYEDMILDGGNRYRACVELGIELDAVQFQGGDPISFVLSANFHRRHLSAGQQAAVVAAAQDWERAHPRGGNKSKVQPLHFETAADRAKASGASLRTQKMADKVAKASPDLAKQVAHGEVTLPEALRRVEGKEKPRKEPMPAEEPENHGPSAEEIAFSEELEAANQRAFDAVSALADEDDKLAAALARIGAQEEEIASLKATVRVQQERINGLMNEKNEAIRLAQSWRRKAEKALKEPA